MTAGPEPARYTVFVSPSSVNVSCSKPSSATGREASPRRRPGTGRRARRPRSRGRPCASPADRTSPRPSVDRPAARRAARRPSGSLRSSQWSSKKLRLASTPTAASPSPEETVTVWDTAVASPLSERNSFAVTVTSSPSTVAGGDELEDLLGAGIGRGGVRTGALGHLELDRVLLERDPSRAGLHVARGSSPRRRWCSSVVSGRAAVVTAAAAGEQRRPIRSAPHQRPARPN